MVSNPMVAASCSNLLKILISLELFSAKANSYPDLSDITRSPLDLIFESYFKCPVSFFNVEIERCSGICFYFQAAFLQATERRPEHLSKHVVQSSQVPCSSRFAFR